MKKKKKKRKKAGPTGTDASLTESDTIEYELRQCRQNYARENEGCRSSDPFFLCRSEMNRERERKKEKKKKKKRKKEKGKRKKKKGKEKVVLPQLIYPIPVFSRNTGFQRFENETFQVQTEVSGNKWTVSILIQSRV